MASYVTRNSEDIFSVTNKTIGDLNSVYTLIQNNAPLTISDVPVGITLEYDVMISPPPAVNSSPATAPPNSIQYTSRQNQNIYDVCLMTLSDLNKIYQLNFNNTITPPLPGTIFNFNPAGVTDAILKKYTSDNNIVFATAVTKITLQNSFLLRQDGFYLLRQDGGRFIRQ